MENTQPSWKTYVSEPNKKKCLFPLGTYSLGVKFQFPQFLIEKQAEAKACI